MTELLIKLFIKNSNDAKNDKVREDYGKLGGTVGIVCNILLCLVKIVMGVTTGSISVIADGLNNLSDMGSSVITTIGFKLAGKPADKDHPFGHGRIEYMSAFIVAVLILIVGFELLTSSFSAIIKGEEAPVYTTASMIILGVSVVIKLWMFFFNRKLGRKIDSAVLTATAQDSVNDAVTTLFILIAAVISTLFTLPFNLDAFLALGVSLFILWSGFSTARDTLDEILGKPPEPEVIDQIRREILSFDEFVGIHDLIVHNYGPGRQFASVHVEVPQDIDIVFCHEQIDICEKLVSERTGVQLVIHMDPIDVNNETVTSTKITMANAIKDIDERLTLHDFRMTPNSSQKTNLIFDVVVPNDLKISNAELNHRICEIAKMINETYCCVITFDNDFSIV